MWFRVGFGGGVGDSTLPKLSLGPPHPFQPLPNKAPTIRNVITLPHPTLFNPNILSEVVWCIVHVRMVWGAPLQYCPFNILWKDVFRLAFYTKWKCFVLIDQILSGTINFVFSVSALYFQIYIFLCKINFTAKNGSGQCNFYSKLEFWKKIITNYFFLFSFIYWCSIIILRKLKKKMN